MIIDAGPTRIDIIGLRAGDRNEVSVTVTSGGAPLDLTNAELRAQARTSPRSRSAIEAVITPVDASKGNFVLAWDPDDVRAVLGTAEYWTGVWDLEVLEEGQTVPITVAAGEITAVLDVTR